jgi:hypothetical protein
MVNRFTYGDRNSANLDNLSQKKQPQRTVSSNFMSFPKSRAGWFVFVIRDNNDRNNGNQESKTDEDRYAKEGFFFPDRRSIALRGPNRKIVSTCQGRRRD